MDAAAQDEGDGDRTVIATGAPDLRRAEDLRIFDNPTGLQYTSSVYTGTKSVICPLSVSES